MGRSWWSFILAWLWHWMFIVRDAGKTFQSKDCVDALRRLDTDHLAPFPTLQIGIGIILLSEENRCRVHKGYGTSGLSRCLWRQWSESWRNCSSWSTCTAQVASADFKFLVGLCSVRTAHGNMLLFIDIYCSLGTFLIFPTFPTFFAQDDLNFQGIWPMSMEHLSQTVCFGSCWLTHWSSKLAPAFECGWMRDCKRGHIMCQFMEICLKLGCNVKRKRANGETFHKLNEANEAMTSKLKVPATLFDLATLA